MSGFSFGAAGNNSNSNKPAFSFGTGNGSGSAAAPSSGFAIGALATSNSSAQIAAPGANPSVTTPAGGFSFGSAASSGTNAKPAFSFGASATPSTSATPLSGGLSSVGTASSSGGFGFAQPAAATAATGGFSLGGSTLAANPATETAAAAPSFSFDAKPAETASSATPASGAAPSGIGGLSFGAPATAAASSKPAVTAGGFSFGQKPTESTAPGTTAAPTRTGGFSFGGAAAATKPGETTPTGGFAIPSTPASKVNAPAPTFAATPVTAQSPLTLSALKTPAPAKTEVPSTPTPSGGFSFGAKPTSAAETTKESKPTGTIGSTPAATTATTTAKVAPSEIITSLRGKTMEDILNDWQSELQNSIATFHRKATEIAKIDARLLENSNKICKLVEDTNAVSSTQTNLLSTLDYIESQQNQLDKELDQFEAKLQAVVASNPPSTRKTLQLGGTVGMQSPYSGLSAEEERERTYELAETLNQDLTHLSQNINETIETVNRLWKKNLPSQQQGDQTMELMTKILNEHFNQLQWIDATTQQLGQRIQEVKRVAEAVGSVPSIRR